jgi:hypothetical protein
VSSFSCANRSFSGILNVELLGVFMVVNYKGEAVLTKGYGHVVENIESIVSIIFKTGNKWLAFDGKTRLNVIISDKKFLNNIKNNNIPLSKADRLFCELKITQFRTAKGERSKYEILEIKEHIKAS